MKNEELQNRRTFFKNAAKKSLPLLGALILATPIFAKDNTIEQTGCKTGCTGGCRTLCQEGCSRSCNGGCKNTCEGRCDKTCKGSATNYWK